MCEHEGKRCPGRSCRCQCMNCQFGTTSSVPPIGMPTVEACVLLHAITTLTVEVAFLIADVEAAGEIEHAEWAHLNEMQGRVDQLGARYLELFTKAFAPLAMATTGKEAT